MQKEWKTFLVQFPGPTGTFLWHLKSRTFGRTTLVTTGVSKKTLTKSHDYSQPFSQEKRRLKIVLGRKETESLRKWTISPVGYKGTQKLT